MLPLKSLTIPTLSSIFVFVIRVNPPYGEARETQADMRDLFLVSPRLASWTTSIMDDNHLSLAYGTLNVHNQVEGFHTSYEDVPYMCTS